MKMRLTVYIAAIVTAVAATLSVVAAADPKPSRTTFQSSAREITLGDNITLKAYVAAVRSDDGVPGGAVEFFDGATSLGSAELTTVDGHAEASLVMSTLALGPHPIAVKYPGDSAFGGSVSVPEFVLVVGQ